MSRDHPDTRAPAGTWVLLRGLSRGSGHWGDFADRLAFAFGCPAHTIDLPGNGTLYRQRSPTRIDAMTEAVRARLQRTGVAPPYHLFAISMGAMVAADWATRHPDELAAAVLVNTSLRPFSPLTQRLRPAALPLLLGLLRPGLEARRREATVARLTSRRADNDPVVTAWVALREAQPVSTGNALRQLLAAARFHAPQRAPAVPLLVLASTRDALVDVRCSRALARHWSAPLVEHPDAGHDLPLDDPAWTLEAVRRWWHGPRRRAPAV